MAFWLMKSEPEVFGIDDLAKRPHQTEHWDGVRNFQARNFMREMKVGDKAFFYHSNATPPGIVGIMEIVKSAYPDFTAWDKKSDHYDPLSTPNKSRWDMVDVRFVKKFKKIITLDELKAHPILNQMHVAKRGNRLSITPVSGKEWEVILGIS